MSNQGKIAVDIVVNDKGSVAVKKFGNEIESAGKRGTSVANSMMTSWKGLAGVISTVSFVALGREVLAIADQYTLLESRLRLVTTGQENLASVQQSLYDISLRTHQSQSDTVDLYTRMARATQQLGISQSDTLTITESINQALIVSGASATESSAALIQLSQGLASGVLRGEEFNSVMEQTPRLAQAIADGLGVTIGQLRAMAKEGQLTADVVTKALLSQKEKIASEYAQMTTTVSQAMTDLGTVVKDIIADANASSEATAGIVTEIQNLAGTIDANRESIISLFTGIVTAAKWSVEAIASIGREAQALGIMAASKEMGFTDWMFGSDEDFKKWIAEAESGILHLKDRIAELSEQRKELAESWAFTSEARIAKQEGLAAIDKEIAATRAQISGLQAAQSEYVVTWQTAAKANDQITASTTSSVAKQVAVVEKGEAEKIKAKTKTVHKQEELDLSYGAFLQRQNVLTADNYIDGWRGAFEGRQQVEQEANNQSEQDAKETTSVIVSEWSNAFESIQGTIADALYEGKISVESFVDIVRRALAEILSAILMSGIKDAFLGMFGKGGSGTGGSIIDGIKELFSGSGGGSGSAWGTIGGGLALAGGAYGLYSGGKNLKGGNTGAGALQMGLGAVSAYKGAVTLGLLEKGAATAAAKSIGAKLGIEIGTTAGKTLATGLSTGYTSGAGATSYATFQSSATGSTAAAGSGLGAGAAAAGTYATIAAAAVMVAHGIYAKSQRPVAENEIDYAGVTPSNLAEINNQWRALGDTILATIPGFQQYESALYSTHNSMLVATGSAGTLALQYNAAAAAGHQWESVMTAMPPALMDAMDKTAAYTRALGDNSGELGETARLAESSRESLNGLNSILSDTTGAITILSSASQSAAAGMAGAANSIMDILGSARQTMVTSGMDGLSYHAAGGIFTGATRIGSHVFGEAGPEAIVPLPYGPDSFEKLFDKIDKIGGGTPIIHVYIGNEKIDARVQVVADRLDADRDPLARGRRYIG